MGLKRETRVIGGVELTCLQFSAMKSYRLFARLGKIVGPALAAMSGAKLAEEFSETDFSELTPALSELLSRLADDEEIVPLLLKQTSCSFKGVQTFLSSEALIDSVFEGESGFKDLLMALKLSLEVNFGYFFKEGLGQVASLTQAENP